MNGWECPGCRRCYSPYKLICDYCGPQNPTVSGTGKCLACNGYHPQGLACPIWTLTAGGM